MHPNGAPASPSGANEDRAAAPPSASRIVAVIGGASFLGRNLIGLLEDDDRVRRIVSIDLETPPTAGTKTRVYRLDMTQPNTEERVAGIFAAEGVDTAAHLLFLSSPSHATLFAHELESVGTMHVLNAARRTNVRKIVMSSTTLVYGAHPTNPNFLTEGHPLRAPSGERFLADKIEAEEDAVRYGASKDRVVTILRTAPVLGPTVQNFMTRYLGRRVVPTLMGFDPLVQFVHEADAIAAFKLAIDRDSPGVFNIVGEGVLPLSSAVLLAGRVPLPLPRTLAGPLVSGLWIARLSEAPRTFLDYLRYLCVADGDLAQRVMGFTPVYTSREALEDFARAKPARQRHAHSESVT